MRTFRPDLANGNTATVTGSCAHGSADENVPADNGAFVLRFSGPGEYRGGYTVANGVITFEWEGWNVAGPWGATGTIRGDSLTVEYNLIMQWTDFEDAVYALAPST